MENSEYENIGSIRYSGADVTYGVIDAGSAGSALLGLDEAVRYFNGQQAPELAGIRYDVPVRTQAGSWEAVVLASLGVGAGTFALSYLKKAGEKMAEKDFKEFGLGDVLKKSMAAIQTLARLVKHSRRARGWNQVQAVVGPDQTSVAITNDRGETLLVPLEFYRWYLNLPPRLLARMTSVVSEGRILTISVPSENPQEDVVIEPNDKALFEDTEDDDLEEEVLFPELIHGQTFILEGRLIRGNEASNSVGLEYQGHVLNCIPDHGSVRQYKMALFLQCIVEGRVNRHSKNRFVAERRPTLILSKVQPLERDSQSDLFTDG